MIGLNSVPPFNLKRHHHERSDLALNADLLSAPAKEYVFVATGEHPEDPPLFKPAQQTVLNLGNN